MNEELALELVKTIQRLASIVRDYARNQPDASPHSSLELQNIEWDLERIKDTLSSSVED